MPRRPEKLTKRHLEALQEEARSDPSIDRLIADGGQPGLAAWARRGRVRFIFRYRPPEGGRRKRLQIDDYGAITLDQARKIALQYRSKIAGGVDPQVEAEAVKQDMLTVADAVERYLTDFQQRAEGPKKGKRSSYQTAKSRLERHVLPTLGKTRLRGLTEDQLRRLHASMVETPSEADRTMTCLAAALSYAEEEGLASDLPRLKKKDRYNQEGTRRALSERELRALGTVLNQAESTGGIELARSGKKRRYVIHPSAVFALRFLALTGFRRADLLGHMSKGRRGKREGLRWSHIDFTSSVVYLEDPKSGQPQERIVGQAVLDLLRSFRPKNALPADPVCPGDVPGQPFIGIDRPRRRLWEAAGIEDHVGRKVDLHSLRHSFASIGANLEHGRYIGHVSALLGHGHQRKSITERYIESNTRALRSSADAIAGEIARLLGLGVTVVDGGDDRTDTTSAATRQAD